MDAHTDTQEPIVAAVRNELTVPRGALYFTAACFAGPGKEWSLAPLQEPGDVKKNPVLVGKLREAVTLLGADRLYAPTPIASNGISNGEIINPAQLSRVFILGGGVVMFRNPKVPADGTFLRGAGDAGIFSAGGCGVIVAILGDRLIFAHAGRESLIDRDRVLGEQGRRRESVVDSIVEAFHELDSRADLRKLHAWVLYSIKPEDFLHRSDDQKHLKYNRLVGPDLEDRGLGAGVRQKTEGVELDLPVVAGAQFVQLGVPERNIHLEHAYLADELPHTRNGGGRYLVAIVRH